VKDYSSHSEHTGHAQKFGYCEVPCPTCSGGVQEKMEARRKSAMVARLFGDSQIPHHARTWTFNTLPADVDRNAVDTTACFVLDLLHNADTTARGLWLAGGPGRCKTGLAISAAKEVMQHERSTLFVMTIELMDRLRASVKKDADISEDELLKAVTETELVVLDDIATERPTPYVLEQFYYVVEKRRSLGLWTIFTSNLSTGDLESYWRPQGLKPGEFHAGLRVIERIREYCIGCAVGGRNQRGR
jgi:DNA replication protein DnaC